MATEVKSASLKGVIKWLIMMGGMSNESNNLRTAEYEVATHTRTNMHIPTRDSESVCVCVGVVGFFFDIFYSQSSTVVICRHTYFRGGGVMCFVFVL